MAGELLIQMFDDRTYRELLPVLNELDATLHVTSACHEALQRALGSPACAATRYQSARGILERMGRSPDLEPKWFLAPSELTLAINALVYLLCFENGGEFSLVNAVGPNWVVLDEAQRSFAELDWYAHMFLGSEPSGERLAFPIRESTDYLKLSREQIESLSKALASLAPDSDANRFFPESVEALRRLAARACATTNLALVYRTLL